MKTHKHLYVAFWRPDILAAFQLQGMPVCVAVCDYQGPAVGMTCDTRDINCEACRTTFLNALPTGDGVKLTYAEWCAQGANSPRLTLKDRAKITAAGEVAAGWRTDPMTKPEAATVWGGPNPAPGPQADLWASAPTFPTVWPGGLVPKTDPFPVRWPGGWQPGPDTFNPEQLTGFEMMNDEDDDNGWSTEVTKP